MNSCMECGEASPDFDTKCSNCGLEFPRRQRKTSTPKIVLAIILTVIAIPLIGLDLLDIRQEFYARPEGRLDKIPGQDLIKIYRDNSSSASIMHDGEWRRISGRILEKRGGDMLDTKSIVLGLPKNSDHQSADFASIPVIVVEMEYKDWMKFGKGDQVILEGRINSMTAADPRGNPPRLSPEILVEFPILIKHLPRQ